MTKYSITKTRVDFNENKSILQMVKALSCLILHSLVCSVFKNCIIDSSVTLRGKDEGNINLLIITSTLLFRYFLVIFEFFIGYRWDGLRNLTSRGKDAAKNRVVCLVFIIIYRPLLLLIITLFLCYIYAFFQLIMWRNSLLRLDR